MTFGKYDYPKSKKTSLSQISKDYFNKDYIETSEIEATKIKKIFRELNK